jgi:chemotaxis protein methyltransferase CheR
MELNLPDQQLMLFSEFVAQTIGLYFPPSRWPDLRRGVAAAAIELGIVDPINCARELMSAPLVQEHLDALAKHLTVGETYFFRESRSFEVLERHILPALIRSRQESGRRLRIWSAGCCTGEEPYSIAISLLRTIPDWSEWSITLLATDLNPNFLLKAESGIFGSWSFRNAPAEIKDRYFRAASDGRFEILPEIKRMVRFVQLNLADDAYPAAYDIQAMDVVFCRNVLMYFAPRQAKKVVENLCRAQTDDGWLIVSPSDSSNALGPGYRAVNFGEVMIYKKGTRPSIPQPQSTEPPATPVKLPTVRRSRRARRIAAIINPPQDAAALYAQGRYDEAADLLEKLLSDRPNDPAILGLLVRALANQGRLTEALDRCDQWIGADKLNPSSHYLRSVVLQEQNAVEGAVQSLQKALYLDPEFVLAHFALGNIIRNRGRAGEAHRHMNNALRSLRRFGPSDVLPESDGITAGRLAEIIGSMRNQEAVA